MKNSWTKGSLTNAIVYLAAGILLLIGPHTLFRVCSTSEKIMKCFWSTAAVNVIGTLIAFGGIIVLLTKTVSAVNLYNAAASLAAVLIPAVLIGGCANENMACRALTFPCVYAVAAVVFGFSIGSLLYLKVRKKET